jgi:hypothetical protein
MSSDLNQCAIRKTIYFQSHSTHIVHLQHHLVCLVHLVYQSVSPAVLHEILINNCGRSITLSYSMTPMCTHVCQLNVLKAFVYTCLQT